MMTPTQIKSMAAGPEMDVLIGRVIFRYAVKDRPEFREVPQRGATARELDLFPGNDWYALERFSTDIAAAWRVVDWWMSQPRRMDERGFGLSANFEDGWIATFNLYAGDGSWLETAHGQTVPVSICRAALLAVLRSREGEGGR